MNNDTQSLSDNTEPSNPRTTHQQQNLNQQNFSSEHESPDQAYFNPDELDSKFQQKKFHFHHLICTGRNVKTRLDRYTLLSIFSHTAIQQNPLQNEEQKSDFLKKFMRPSNEKILNALAKYEPSILSQIYWIEHPYSFQVMPNFAFPHLERLYFKNVDVESLEPLAWISAPFFCDFRALNTKIFSLKGLIKSNFPKLKYFFFQFRYFGISKHNVTDMCALSRLFVQEQVSVVIIRRNPFYHIDIKQIRKEKDIYSMEVIIRSLNEFANLNMIAKVPSRNFSKKMKGFLLPYLEILFMIYECQTSDLRLSDKAKMWKKKDLVEREFMRFMKTYFQQQGYEGLALIKEKADIQIGENQNFDNNNS